MKIECAPIPATAGYEHRSVLRVSLAGGCSIKGCHCSDEPWISIGNGTTWARAVLTEAEVKKIRDAVAHGTYAEIVE